MTVLGDMRCRLQVQRFTETGVDQYGARSGSWGNVGSPIYASRADVSDGERARATGWDNLQVLRFTVRSMSFAKSITRADRLEYNGVIFEIDGIKELGNRRGFLEITAKTMATE